MKTTLKKLNQCNREEFIAVCGPLFENSPWVAERTCAQGPFLSLEALHAALVQTMHNATTDEKLKLIRAHPDLVGRMALAGKLTDESKSEQAAAGLVNLSVEEIAKFTELNGAYHAKFGFPFVICARENKKDAILAAFPQRLANSREQEIEAALSEIAKIAKLRLFDAVSE